MTENELRARVCAQARLWLGRREADGSHREIIDVYNQIVPLPRGYRLRYDDPWCAGFVSAVAQELGLTAWIFPECGCSPMVELYRKAGRWMEDDAYLPAPGDVLFYDWQDSGAGDNRGQPDHVGYVLEVDGSMLTIIEGNCGNQWPPARSGATGAASVATACRTTPRPLWCSRSPRKRRRIPV